MSPTLRSVYKAIHSPKTSGSSSRPQRASNWHTALVFIL